MAADILDQAAEAAEFALQMQLRARKPELPRTGFCHNCDEPVDPQAAYCDQDCREDHERRQRR